MGKVNHEIRAHALLSASGASRWLACTPSARLEEKFAESGSSSFAEEGTLAHEFGDLTLRWIKGELVTNVYKKEIKILQAHKLYSSEMDTEVAKYTSAVWETFLVARAKTPDAKLLIEEKLDFSHLVEKGFGTGDACIIADGTLNVMDLKYGKGIRVDADENPQLMLYGLGALRSFEMLYDIHTVELTIIQPRLDHISTWSISVADLIAWGENVVKPKAAEAYKGEGEQCAGEHCKWCKVKPMCKTLAAMNMELAKHDFADPQLLTEEELLDIYKQIPMLSDWANAIAEYILTEAVKGKSWEGYKLVEGRSNRKYTDEKAVMLALQTNGFKPEQYLETSLLPITKMEASISKAKFNLHLGDLVSKPQGKPTLALNTDKRPVFNANSAEKDFEDTEELS